MIPIHELLARIRWDREFGRARFDLGFFDRREGGIQRVALRDVVFPGAGRRTFQFWDATGQARRVPFHRIREVYRDGVLLWRRPQGSEPGV